jgi:hypothetical protein
MSFDVFLQRFEAGQSAQVSRERVLAVLRATKFHPLHSADYYAVEFPDGSDVEFAADGLQGTGDFKGCAFFIHGMSQHLVRFMLEVAKAGDMVILPAMEPFVPILSLAEQQKQLPAELAENDPEPVLCGSPEELEILLSGGYEGWQNYRDRVLRENRGV